ncbi:MAG: hypothetical protein MUF54_03085, partial [Polyangiaceae bacterium]|nr:hypothetical protein [Polyangiaceae bacterium]
SAPAQVQILATVADLLRQARKFSDCVAVLDKAIALRQAAELIAARGVCRRGNKDNAGAKADYQRAVDVDPAYGPAYFLLGQHLLQVDKNRAAAVSAFEKCAAVAPDSKCKEAAETAKKGK